MSSAITSPIVEYSYVDETYLVMMVAEVLSAIIEQRDNDDRHQRARAGIEYVRDSAAPGQRATQQQIEEWLTCDLVAVLVWSW